MTGLKSDIIAQLQKDLLCLQGFKSTLKNNALDIKLGALINAFPCNTFPLGAIHEFVSFTPEEETVTQSFIACILAPLMQGGGITIWIGAAQAIFPPALQALGIAPDKIIFIDLKKEKEMLWAMEEALRCNSLAAVIGEVQELSFTASRRLQLAVEESRITGFIIRRKPRNLNATACVTRWKITTLPSELNNNMPGVGFSRWKVELLKVKNGRPGSWQIECINGDLRHIYTIAALTRQLQKKAG